MDRPHTLISSPPSGPVKMPVMVPLPEAERLQRRRIELGDDAGTTVHIALYPRSGFRARLVRITPVAALKQWSSANGVADAIVGGFFIRAEGMPLGELRLDGVCQPSQPFESPWDRTRACIQIDGDEVRCASRSQFAAEPRGDLLQAGPLLVEGGVSCLVGTTDAEGFSAAAHQFDSDITHGRFPRAALGINQSTLIAVVCDGRSDSDAGMSLAELAATMVELGATEAINLDGGGSASLLVGGQLVNVPREEHGRLLAGGRAISTAITFGRHRSQGPSAPDGGPR